MTIYQLVYCTTLILCLFLSGSSTVFANSTYIAISNQIARKNQLAVVANNVANVNTVGFEAESVMLKNVNSKQNIRKSDAFVYTETSYKRDGLGELKMTNRALDIAIVEPGYYFKIITPNGFKYTLNGSMIINHDNVLVSSNGNSYANRDNQPILLPLDYQNLSISEDGAIYIDGVIVDFIGVFRVENPNSLKKEGNNLYSVRGNDLLANEDISIISGALRASNANATQSMAEMIESQRSVSMSDNLLSDLAALERSVITKIAK